MKIPNTMKPEVFNTLKSIERKDIHKNIYEAVWKHENEFQKMGVLLEDISDLLEMKEKAEDFPNQDFYQVCDEWRARYIYDNLANPNIKLRGDNERSFWAAVCACDSWRIEYDQKAEYLANTVGRSFAELSREQAALAREGWSSWHGIKHQLGRIIGEIETFISGDVNAGISQLEDRVVKQGKANDLERAWREKGINAGQTNMPAQEKKVGNAVAYEDIADDDKLFVFSGEEKKASDQMTTLYRIKANQNLSLDSGIRVSKGQLGGWIESENNLYGNSWVGGDAEVFGKAKVVNSAILDDSVVRNCAVVKDCCVMGNARVLDGVYVEDSLINDWAQVSGNSILRKAVVDGYSSVSGASRVENSSCCMNTHVVDSVVVNADYSGDIFIDSFCLDYGKSFTKRGSIDSVSPLLLDELMLEKLRASRNEGGLKEVELSEVDGKRIVADLNLVKGDSMSMKLSVTNSVIHSEGLEFNGQSLIDTLEIMYSGMENVSPKDLYEILSELPPEFLTKQNSIVQDKNLDTTDRKNTEIKPEPAIVSRMDTTEMKEMEESGVENGETTVASKDRLWEFTGEKKLTSDQGAVLHQIRANQDFSFGRVLDISEGAIGGWIEDEKNLVGDTWVGDNAEVRGEARVIDSFVLGNSVVRDCTKVEKCVVSGDSFIMDNAQIEESYIADQACISGKAVLKSSVVDGYSSVSGESYLDNSLCLKNTHVTDSSLLNVSMDGDFKVDSRKLEFVTEPRELKSFGSTTPQLITDDTLNELRANQTTGLKEVVLFSANGREFIADLNLEDGGDMEMNLVVSNPIIRSNGVDYDGQKLVDSLKKTGNDIVKVEAEKLSAMLAGKPRLFGSKGYVIQQEGDDFGLVNVRKRVSGIQIYSHKAGGMAIRCMIDGVQQLSKMLSVDDLRSFSDKTDRKALAIRYFADEFQEGSSVECSMKR